jgi:hypothetical protein
MTLPTITAANGTRTLRGYAAMPNGVPDSVAYNDTVATTFVVRRTPQYRGEFREDFDSGSTSLHRWNVPRWQPGRWGISSLASRSGGHALAVNSDGNGQVGMLNYADLPPVRLQAGTSSQLQFSYAYAYAPYSFEDDSLHVLISTDCGNTWETLFGQGGAALSTADTLDVSFYPNDAAQWRTETVSLASYSGDVLVRFRQRAGGYGNNMYLDDIRINTATATAANSIKPGLEVYPNPAQSSIRVSGIPPGSAYSLKDLAGKQFLHGESARDQTLIEVNHIPAGVYLLHTAQGMRKIIICR